MWQSSMTYVAGEYSEYCSLNSVKMYHMFVYRVRISNVIAKGSYAAGGEWWGRPRGVIIVNCLLHSGAEPRLTQSRRVRGPLPLKLHDYVSLMVIVYEDPSACLYE